MCICYSDRMSLYCWIFPEHSRSFRGIRGLNIALRTLHLIGIAGIGGAYLYPVDHHAWQPYLWLTVLSGLGLVAVSLYGNGIWLIQLRGLVILLKLLLLSLLTFLPEVAFQGGIVVIVLSSVIAHAPGKWRYYSPWHRRCVERL